MQSIMCFVLLLMAGIGPVMAAEPDQLTRIGNQIQQHAVIRAEFTQSKQMAALKRPLVTSGHLVFSRQLGVLWQIEQPYRISYVLGEERIVEIAADGTRRERGLREVPGLAQVGRVFRALLSANTAMLGDIFDIDVHGDPAIQWGLELKPRQAQLAQFLSALKLSGGRFVDTIDITEGSGDLTRIRFRNPRSAQEITDAEAHLFGSPDKR